MHDSLKTQHWKYVFALILMFGFGFYLARILPNTNEQPSAILAQPKTTTNNSSLNIPYIDQVWKTLNDKFIDTKKLDLAKMEDSALRGFVRGIGDPYTMYMTPDESKEFSIDLDGELEGIGLVLETKDEIITVVSAIKNSPAQKAGLKPNDIIYKINDTSTETISLLEAVKMIRGKKGTAVKITVLRQGEGKPLDFNLIRDSIRVESVSLEKKGDIYHVIINQFNDTTEKGFDEVVQQALLEKPKGMIIDVRGNGGGYLDTSIHIISEFFKKDTVAAKIKTRDPAKNQILKSEKDGRLLDIPVVVLIDGGSASASEILAGTLQDHKRAILMGEKSFGKGSVQELERLSNGGILRLTIAKWYTPNDNNIDQTGIKPDIEVKYTKEDAAANKDPQLDAAIKYLTR